MKNTVATGGKVLFEYKVILLVQISSENFEALILCERLQSRLS